jgi:hypothetical protein
LSSVALSLAVLAFAIQIIVFVVQATESAAATRRPLGLHAELSGLLSELRERTGSTQKSVDVINARLLEAVIGKTKSDSGVLDTENFAEEVASRYADAARTSESGIESTGPASRVERTRPKRSNFPPPPSRDEARQIRAELESFPSQADAAAAMAALRDLSTDAQDDLLRVSRDALQFSDPNSSLGPGVNLNNQELIESGLAKKIRGWRLYTITPKGRSVGRLLTARGDLPEYLNPIAELRQRIISEYDSRISALLDNRDHGDS